MPRPRSADHDQRMKRHGPVRGGSQSDGLDAVGARVPGKVQPELSGAAVAWATADNALQIHGGNGYAMEYQISRVLCDARILNIFEGAAEIQAQVIARRLLSE